MYSENELAEIQELISGKRTLSENEIEILKKEFAGKEIPEYLHPFAALYATNPDLYSKVSQDKLIRKYSIFGFFPETHELAYGSEISPEISFEYGNRGYVVIIKTADRGFVIKPLQSSREKEIVQAAGDEGVGPKQYKSLCGFLTENLAEGRPFTELDENERLPENVAAVGKRTGEILSKLHKRDIYYNDKILANDFGESHIIVAGNSPAMLIDYGVTLMLDRHPDLSDEDAWNYTQTLPGISLFIFPEMPKEKIQALIQKNRQLLRGMTKEEIMLRDVDFIDEGIYLTEIRWGRRIRDAFMSGFRQSYDSHTTV